MELDPVQQNLDLYPIEEGFYLDGRVSSAIDEKFAADDSILESPFKDILLKEVTVTAKRPPFYYSKPDITINLDDKDPTGKKYRSVSDMIRQEFGEKAFTRSNGKPCMPTLVGTTPL